MQKNLRRKKEVLLLRSPAAKAQPTLAAIAVAAAHQPQKLMRTTIIAHAAHHLNLLLGAKTWMNRRACITKKRRIFLRFFYALKIHSTQFCQPF